jgi:hypothetical protein
MITARKEASIASETGCSVGHDSFGSFSIACGEVDVLGVRMSCLRYLLFFCHALSYTNPKRFGIKTRSREALAIHHQAPHV